MKTSTIFLVALGGLAIVLVAKKVLAKYSNFGGYKYGDIAEEDPHTLILHS
jgi:hypothetical protein